jgi:hypothetical protein
MRLDSTVCTVPMIPKQSTNRFQGYSHENPSDMTLEQQRDVLDKTHKLLTDFCGKPPRGSVAPWYKPLKKNQEIPPSTNFSMQVGDEPRRRRADAKLRHRVRPLDVARRRQHVLAADRRHLDENRLHAKSRNLDEALGQRQGDRTCRNPWQLVYCKL